MNKRNFCTLFFSILLLVSCNKDPVKETVKQFYYSFQNLEFEQAKLYCTPLLVQKITLIQNGISIEKRNLIEFQLKKNRIKIEKIQFNEPKNRASVAVRFTQFKDNNRFYTEEIIELEKINNRWLICNF